MNHMESCTHEATWWRGHGCQGVTMNMWKMFDMTLSHVRHDSFTRWTCERVMSHMQVSHVEHVKESYCIAATHCCNTLLQHTATSHIALLQHTAAWRSHIALIAIPSHAVDNWWISSKISSLVILYGEFSRAQTFEKSYQPILWSFRRLPALTHTHPHTRTYTHIHARAHTHIDADTDRHASTDARTHARNAYIYIHVHVHPRAYTHKRKCHRQTVMTAN